MVQFSFCFCRSQASFELLWAQLEVKDIGLPFSPRSASPSAEILFARLEGCKAAMSSSTLGDCTPFCLGIECNPILLDVVMILKDGARVPTCRS